MLDAYLVFATVTAGYVLGRHHEAGNDDFAYLFWSLVAGVIWPIWFAMASYYGIREGK